MKYVLLLALSLSCIFEAFAEEKSHHWNYEEVSKWGEASEFATCKAGKAQSPINIVTKSVIKSDIAPLDTHYVNSKVEIVNNGHTVQLNLTSAGFAYLKNKQYKLLQFHFHTPSEEKINGKNFPLVIHLVHKDDVGNLGVIAVMIKQGKENIALKNVFINLPKTEGKKELADKINPSDFLPHSLSYYGFNGSLTTPPCSEGVAWHVLKEPIELSKGQIESFKTIFKMNARPIQALNGRVVEESK
jgi:carbonic anhydrase